MNVRRRQSRLSREQWEIQRERFQIESDHPSPIEDHAAAIKEPVKNLIQSLGIRLDSVQQRLMNAWPEIAGTPLCRHTRPGPLENGSLTIYVTNSVMLAELSRFQGATLLKNVQRAVGEKEIRKLYFLPDPDTRGRR